MVVFVVGDICVDYLMILLLEGVLVVVCCE